MGAKELTSAIQQNIIILFTLASSIGRTQCRELLLCAGSGEGCQWQALPSPMQCEETATRTRDLPATDGKTLPLAPGLPFITMQYKPTKNDIHPKN